MRDYILLASGSPGCGGENPHRCDLTKEQRDQHIRRYAELLAVRVNAEKLQVRQNDAPEYAKPPQQVKGVASRVAEETGLSVRTVQRALNPPEPKAPLPDYDVVTVQFNALMAAWIGTGTQFDGAGGSPRCSALSLD